jgi:hypothetical protein
VNDVSHEFPFLALFSEEEDAPIKRARERQRRDGSTEAGPPKGMVFSKDACFSGRCKTASGEANGKKISLSLSLSFSFEPTPIFTHFLPCVPQRNVASIIARHKNTQLFLLKDLTWCAVIHAC